MMFQIWQRTSDQYQNRYYRCQRRTFCGGHLYIHLSGDHFSDLQRRHSGFKGAFRQLGQQRTICSAPKNRRGRKNDQQGAFLSDRIFFFIPLALAVVPSVFGMIFIKIGLQSMGQIDYFSSILSAAVIFILIYGAYFFSYLFWKQKDYQEFISSHKNTEFCHTNCGN